MATIILEMNGWDVQSNKPDNDFDDGALAQFMEKQNVQGTLVQECSGKIGGEGDRVQFSGTKKALQQMIKAFWWPGKENAAEAKEEIARIQN